MEFCHEEMRTEMEVLKQQVRSWKRHDPVENILPIVHASLGIFRCLAARNMSKVFAFILSRII